MSTVKNTFLDYGYSAAEIEKRVNDTFTEIFIENSAFFRGFFFLIFMTNCSKSGKIMMVDRTAKTYK